MDIGHLDDMPESYRIFLAEYLELSQSMHGLTGQDREKSQQRMAWLRTRLVEMETEADKSVTETKSYENVSEYLKENTPLKKYKTFWGYLRANPAEPLIALALGSLVGGILAAHGAGFSVLSAVVAGTFLALGFNLVQKYNTWQTFYGKDGLINKV